MGGRVRPTARPLTRPLSELDTVDWAALTHAHGTASDVPGLIRALATDRHEQALHALYGNIFHQGGRFGATAYAVPFLLGLVADPATPARADLVHYLGALAIGYDETFLPGGVAVESWRTRVADQLAANPDVAYREFDAWVAQAGSESERRGREWRRSLFDPMASARAAAHELATYEAVLAGAPVIVGLLDDSSPLVRAAAVYVLGWLPSFESTARVRTLLTGAEPDGVVATAVVTLGLLGVPPTTVRPYLTHRCAVVRWAAAIALARLGEAAPQVVEALAGFVVAPPPQPEPPVRFYDGDFRGYAAMSVAAMRDRVPTPVLDALLTGLAQASGPSAVATTVAVLSLTFGPPEDTRPPFAELTRAQQRTVHTLARMGTDSWQLVNFTEVLRDWRLPATRAEFQQYVEA